jgi:hypothetical protein
VFKWRSPIQGGNRTTPAITRPIQQPLCQALDTLLILALSRPHLSHVRLSDASIDGQPRSVPHGAGRVPRSSIMNAMLRWPSPSVTFARDLSDGSQLQNPWRIIGHVEPHGARDDRRRLVMMRTRCMHAFSTTTQTAAKARMEPITGRLRIPTLDSHAHFHNLTSIDWQAERTRTKSLLCESDV